MGDVEVEQLISNEEHSAENELKITSVCSAEYASDQSVCRKLQFGYSYELEDYQDSSLSEHEVSLKNNDEQISESKEITDDLKKEDSDEESHHGESENVILQTQPHQTLDTVCVSEEHDCDGTSKEADEAAAVENKQEQVSFLPQESPPKISDGQAVAEQATDTEVNEVTYTNLAPVPTPAFAVENENQFLAPRLPIIQHHAFAVMKAPGSMKPAGVRFHQPRFSRATHPGTPYPRSIAAHAYPPGHMTGRQPGWQRNNMTTSFQPIPNYRIPTNAIASDPSDNSTDSSSYVSSSFSSSSSSIVSSGENSDSPSDYRTAEDNPLLAGQSFITPDGQHITKYKDAYGNIRYFYPMLNERENHNVKERKRRSRVAESCSTLRSLIPGLSDKTDKATVFEFAARYLTFLRGKFGIQFDQAYVDKYYQ